VWPLHPAFGQHGIQEEEANQSAAAETGQLQLV
jgi:hypothetical protein